MSLQHLALAYVGKNQDFVYQIAGACLMAAKDIKLEGAGTVNHANRLIWANKVLVNPEGKAREILMRVLANTTVAAAMPTPTDNDIQFVVNSLVDQIAG